MLALLLLPPLIWFVVVYLGALAAMLVNSFFALDGFTGKVVREFTLQTYAKLLLPTNLQIFARTTAMASAVTAACVVIGFPLAYYIARFASRRLKTAALPGRHAASVVQLRGARLLVEAHPGAGGHRLVVRPAHSPGWLAGSVFEPAGGRRAIAVGLDDRHLHRLCLHLAALHDPAHPDRPSSAFPRSLLDASGDLGAGPRQTFRHVVLPLALPGVVAGSIFTFSLTLGDFIVPSLFGNSSFFIGKAVLSYQGTSGNIPLAAAFTMGPILIMIMLPADCAKAGSIRCALSRRRNRNPSARRGF